MEDDEGRALLAAYLPAVEPPDAPLAAVVTRARAVRRRHRAVLAGAASVVAVLATAAAVGVAPDRAAGPPAGPAPTPDATPHFVPCREVSSDGDDPGAGAWSRWVLGRLGPPARAGGAWWSRSCGPTPAPGVRNVAEFALGPEQLVTALATRTSPALTATARPCRPGPGVELVTCEQTRLPDGSLLVRRDYRQDGQQPVREAARLFPDGRSLGLRLTYLGAPRGFDRLARTRDQLAAIVTDPGAQAHFPAP